MPEVPITDIVDLARRSEALGYDRCWVYDEGIVTRDVYVTMTAIALATTTLHVGPGITNAYTRHPSQTAAAIASLDELSGGRAFLGIGAGGSVPLDPIAVSRGVPLTTVREMIEVCRHLFSGQRRTYQGKTVQLSNATMPYGRADLPIWFAGRGPKMLQLGGALADGVMLDFTHVDAIADQVAIMRAGARSTHTQPQLCYSTLIVSEADSLDDVRPHLTYRLVDSQPSVRAKLGLTDRDVESIREAMADGLSAAGQLIRDEWVIPFVISGTKDECARTLAELVDRHGIDEFMLPVLDPHTAVAYQERGADVVARTRRLLAR